MGKKFYIQMFSIHGLIIQDRLEMGRDADTGGQVIYILDQVKHIKNEIELSGITI